MFTGHPEQLLKLKPEHPDLMCIAHKARSDASRRVPVYVGVNPIPYLGSAYLGPAYEPFSVHGDPNTPGFRVPEIGLANPAEVARLNGRMGLAGRFDRLRRVLDDRMQSDTFDAFQRQALTLLTGPEARRAFDLDREDPRVRDRYGRNTWGQRCLLARRLVEAGVDLVTTSLDGPLCGRVGNWDDHAVNHHVFDAMKSVPVFRPGRERLDRGHPRARPRPPRPRRGDRGVWPHPQDQLRPGLRLGSDAAGPRPLAPRRLAPVQRRGHPRRSGRRGDRPDRGRRDEPARRAFATSWRRSTGTWVSTPNASCSRTGRVDRFPCSRRAARSQS